MATRECPFCGKTVYDRLTQCPYCREPLPMALRVRSSSAVDDESGGKEIRTGLLCVMMAALIGYFAGGFSPSPMNLPIPVPPIVYRYLSPLLFLSGIGLTFYGYYLNFRSHRQS